MRQFDLKTITADQVRDMLEAIFLEEPPELPESDEIDITPGQDRPYSWEPEKSPDPDDGDDEIEAWDEDDVEYFGGIDDES